MKIRIMRAWEKQEEKRVEALERLLEMAKEQGVMMFDERRVKAHFNLKLGRVLNQPLN